MRILIATHNPAKLSRYQELLKDISDLELVSLKDIEIKMESPEPFLTAKENAIYKAKEYAKMSGLPTLAIDEATLTNFLPTNEQPGVYVRRVANTDKKLTDDEALLHWRKVIDSSSKENKTFTWDYSIAFFNPTNNALHVTQAITTMRVADEFSKKRLPGYPMSSFLMHEARNKPHVELTPEERLESDKKIFSNFVQEFKKWISVDANQ